MAHGQGLTAQQRPSPQQRKAMVLEALEERRLLSAHLVGGIWQIRGDGPAQHQGQQIVVQVNPDDVSQWQALIGGEVIDQRAASAVRGLRILGGRGDDDIRVQLPTAISAIIFGSAGNDTIAGGVGPDRIYGGPGNDILSGGLGDDRLDGGAGNDQIDGGDGADIISGNSGGDSVFGGTGDDLIYGGQNSDDLGGGFGNDRILGGIGDDLIRGGEGADQLDGGGGRNQLFGQNQRDNLRLRRGDELAGDDNQDELTRQSADELRQWLIDSAVEQYSGLFGQTVSTRWWWWRERFPVEGMPRLLNDMVAMAAALGPNVVGIAGGEGGGDSGGAGGSGGDSGGESGGGGGDFSGTNNQVAGVDEQDFVKTNGSHIFLLADGELIIFAAEEAQDLAITARTPIEGFPVGVFLIGDQAVVLSQVYQDAVVELPAPGEPGEPGDLAPLPLFAGPGLAVSRLAGGWGWQQPQTKVTLVDVSDPSLPAVVEESYLDGNLSAARAIGERIYLVLQNNFQLPAPDLLPTDNEFEYVYEDADSYRQRLEDGLIDEQLPGYRTVTADGESTGSLAVGADLFLGPHSYRPNMLSLVDLNLGNDQSGPDAVTSVLGIEGQVYADQDSLYVAAQVWDWGRDNWFGSAGRTDVYKFSLGAEQVELQASGAVPGWIHDQFSLDEEDGYLRIATTSDTGGLSNNLYVLEERDGSLETVGAVTGLASSERIFSVRFQGSRGYMCTFRQVDPLFTFDLSDPSNPLQVGELHIPGYSSYLQPMGADHLIGFGRDGDETGRLGGLKLTLFDVSDLANPQQIDGYLITEDGSFWSSSEAEWDQHAFSYFADQGIIALPVNEGTWWVDGGSGLEVFAVDEQGFTALGRVEQEGQVRRSLRIGSVLYSISDQSVQAQELLDPTALIAVVNYQASVG